LGCPPQLRGTEFFDHSIDTRLALVAIVTKETHKTNLTLPPTGPLSRFEQRLWENRNTAFTDVRPVPAETRR